MKKLQYLQNYFYQNRFVNECARKNLTKSKSHTVLSEIQMNFRSLKKEVKIFDLIKFQSLSYVYRAVILFDETELYAYFIDITIRRERTILSKK